MNLIRKKSIQDIFFTFLKNPRHPIRRFLSVFKKITFLIFWCVCFLIILNLLLHAYQKYIRGYPLEDTIFGRWYKYYYFLGKAFKPNSGGRSGKVWDYRINSCGFKGAEFKLKKDSDLYRIVCFGGSTTDVSDYPTKLADILKDEYTPSGKKFEVINAAVPGWNTTQSLIQFITRVIYLEPDVIIIYHGINDHTMKPYYWLTSLPEVEFKTYGSFMKNHFILYNVIRNKLNRIAFMLSELRVRKAVSIAPDDKLFEIGKHTVPDEYNMIFKTNIENFIILSKNRNIKVMLCPMALSFDRHLSIKKNLSMAGLYCFCNLEYIVARVTGYNQIIRDLAQKYEAFYLDVSEAIKPGKENFIDLCHFTEAGAMKMAQGIKDKFVEIKIIKQ